MLKLVALPFAVILLNYVCVHAQDSARMNAYNQARYYTLKKTGTCLVVGGASAMVAGTFAMANAASKTVSAGTLHANASFDKQALPGAILFAGGGVALVLGIARITEAKALKDQHFVIEAHPAPLQIGKSTIAQTGFSVKWQIGM
jgi:hypothetical protein